MGNDKAPVLGGAENTIEVGDDVRAALSVVFELLMMVVEPRSAAAREARVDAILGLLRVVHHPEALPEATVGSERDLACAAAEAATVLCGLDRALAKRQNLVAPSRADLLRRQVVRVGCALARSRVVDHVMSHAGVSDEEIDVPSALLELGGFGLGDTVEKAIEVAKEHQLGRWHGDAVRRVAASLGVDVRLDGESRAG